MNQQDVTARQTLLLLGPDQRMELWLRDHFSDYRLVTAPNVLHGIMLCQNQAFAAVLLDAECLKQKTLPVAKALRQVRTDCKLILYGEPYAEIYAGPALRNPQVDYLVWPIPPSQLREKLQPPRPMPHPENGPSSPLTPDPYAPPVPPVELVHHLQQLAAEIPHGQAAIIEQAQQLLPQALGRQWVKIHLADPKTTPPTPPDQDLPDRHNPNSEIIPLMQPDGVIGQMVLGPPSHRQPSAQLAQQAAMFLTTLLNLAQRDEHLKFLATVDELTGAYNRRYLEHFIRHILRHDNYKQTQATLLVFDIDGFKYFNDTYGHAAGDVILCEATQLIRRCCREHDVVARIGGDEFAVLFWDTGQKREKYPKPQNGASDSNGSNASLKSHEEMVVFVSNRFRRLMQTAAFPCLGPDARGTLTISGGLARLPQDADTVEKLLARADSALLNAKRSGKNRIYLVGHPQSDYPED